jgi:glycosyltransferase involved in cell wall biosynthesis
VTELDASRSISVVIPVRNGAAFIDEAMASVYAQTAPPLEVIVVDDGSIDGSLVQAQARYPTIRAIRQESAGAGAARNRGVQLARGKYLAFLDADDRWPSNRLALLLAAIEGLESPGMAFGHVRHFLCSSLEEEARRRLHCPAGTAPGFSAVTMLIRLSDFRRVGAFEEDLKVGEFISWIARARDLDLAQAMIEEVVLERRIHMANHALQQRKSFGDYAHVLKRTLDRRRSQSPS